MENVSNQIDPGTGVGSNRQSSVNTAKDQAAGLADAVKSSEVGGVLPFRWLYNAASALNTVQNSQIAQDLANGPAAQTVKKEATATSNEFSDLASSRKMPEYSAANDTPLTHYHSFFFSLLSWKNPRATGISFAGILVFIFACRYLPIIRLSLKGTWTILGVVTLAEIAAKYTIGSSVASSVRPRKYYKIPKESLEATLDDVEQLINFFVIEIQRIVFAENIPNTALAFFASFLSYYLVKLLPAWGFALFSTCVVFIVPLIYTQNKELIDSQLEHANKVVTAQAQQLRDITAENTSKGLESVKAYTGDFASTASEYIGKSRQKIPLVATNGNTNTSGATAVKDGDFPSAPRSDLPSTVEHSKPSIHAPGDGNPIAASAT